MYADKHNILYPLQHYVAFANLDQAKHKLQSSSTTWLKICMMVNKLMSSSWISRRRSVKSSITS